MPYGYKPNGHFTVLPLSTLASRKLLLLTSYPQGLLGVCLSLKVVYLPPFLLLTLPRDCIPIRIHPWPVADVSRRQSPGTWQICCERLKGLQDVPLGDTHRISCCYFLSLYVNLQLPQMKCLQMYKVLLCRPNLREGGGFTLHKLLSCIFQP